MSTELDVWRDLVFSFDVDCTNKNGFNDFLECIFHGSQ